MKKLFYFPFILAGFLLVGCQNELDINLSEDPAVPAVVVSAVKKEFPTATQLQFSTVSANEIWESQFQVNNNQVIATVDKKGVILEANADTKEITLPESIKTYLTNKYKDFKVISSSESFKDKILMGYKVYLRSATQEVTAIFDAKGAFVMEFVANIPTTAKPATKTYPIDPKVLPDVITKLLSGREFLKGLVVVDKNNVKTYVVVLKQGNTYWDLTLDDAGKVIKENKYTIEPKKYTSKVLGKADLPKAITDYLDLNQKGWILDKGVLNLINDVADSYMITVKITGTNVIWFLSFDKAGKIVKSSKVDFTIPKVEEKVIVLVDLPKAVKDYIDAHYKAWTMEKGIVTYVDNKATAYTILIAEGGVKYILYFDANAKFVGAKRG